MARALYEKQTWENLPSEETSISAERLDHIEQGIYDNSNKMAIKEIYGDNSVSLGRKIETNVGHNSLVNGDVVEASGDLSQASGLRTIASGNAAHAEGGMTTANKEFTHAEGYGTTASAPQSHSEGANTTASGNGSHSEGYMTVASGTFSHSEGYETVANGYFQHAEGRYNKEDSINQYANIVGGGTSDDDRKNIYTLDWEGNATYAGTVESKGLILTDTSTEQKYKLTVENGNIAITAVE